MSKTGIPNYEVVNLEVDTSGYLVWITKFEDVAFPFIIEQYIWNKWNKIADTLGNGGYGKNEYKIPVNFHYGENRFRIKQVDGYNRPRYSKPIVYLSNIEKATFSLSENELKFSRKLMYEIYDFHGELKYSGFNEKIDISDLN